MKSADKVVIIFLVLAITVAGYFVGNTDGKRTQAKNIKVLEEQITFMKKPAEINTEAPTAWIIKHSTRISDTIAKYIAVEAFKYPHPLLILSLIEVESEFIPTAVSKVGAVGLGQIIYDIHKKDLAALGIHKKRDLFDVDRNIKATSFILQMMLKRSNNDVEKALHFYLGGRDGKYVSRIFSNYVHLSLEIENDVPKM